jgi:signal transduction histidine kinase/GAF domain-containing protein
VIHEERDRPETQAPSGDAGRTTGGTAVEPGAAPAEDGRLPDDGVDLATRPNSSPSVVSGSDRRDPPTSSAAVATQLPLEPPLEPASIFGALAAGVTVQDEQGRLVFANTIAATMSGFASPTAMMAADPAELLERIELIDEDGAPFAWDRLPGRRVLAGASGEPTLVGFRQRSTAVEQWSIVEARLIVEPDGRRLVVNTFHDVTPRIEIERSVRASERRYREMADERRQAEEQARLLADAALHLDEARDVDEAARAAAEAPIPTLADWCIIDLLEPDGSLRRAAMAARDADLAARIEPLRDHPAIRGTGRASERAVAGREVVFLADVGEASRHDKRLDPDLREIIVATGVRSLIAQPLIARGEVIGSMVFAVGADRSYDAADLERTAEMARRVGPAVANTMSNAAEQRARRSAEELARRMAQLQAVTRTLAEATDRGGVVAIVGDEARRALDAGTVAIGLVDEPEGSVELLSFVGADRSAAAEANLSAAIASGEAIWIDDFGVDDTANDQGPANRSGCAVPLVADGTMFGALWLGFPERRQFAAADRRLIQTFADLAAGSLSRIRLGGIRERLVADIEAERSRLETVLRRMPIGVVLAEAPDGPFVFANDAAIRLSPVPIELGQPPRYDRARGRRPDGTLLDPADWPLARAMAGETVENEVIEIETADGPARSFSMSAAPIADRTGAIAAAVVTYSDISDRIRSQERERFLARASEVLASSLDFERTIQTVADLAVPQIADWCVVQMAGEEGPRRIAVAHPDPAKLAIAIQLQEEYPENPDAEVGTAAILRNGRPEYVADIPPEAVDAAARDDRHREMLRALGLRSYISVPLVAAGRIIGVLTLVTGDSGRRLEPDDVPFAENLAARAASAIENARLFREGVRFKRLLDATHDAVLMFDPETGRIDYANQGAADQLGAPAEALVGTLLADHLDGPPRDPGAGNGPSADASGDLGRLVRPLLAGPVDTRTETLRFRSATGTSIPVEVRLQAVPAGGGEPSRILAIARDIRDRIESQERLRALASSEHARAAELNAVIRAMGEGVFVCDAGGRIILANPAAEDVFPDVEERTYAEILDQIDDPDHQAPKLGERGGPVELPAKRGDDRWVELSTWPVAPEDAEGGHRDETIVMLRDVTVQRRQQVVRDTFIGVLSHELRTPVTTIYAGSKVLSRSTDLSAETQREIFDDIASEAERLHRLVEDVVAMTRFGEDAGELGAEPVLLQRVVPTVIESEEGRWPEVRFGLTIPPGLPTIIADPTYVEQVIRNLLSNAAKYGGRGATVETVVEAAGPEVLVRILDNGPGFPADEADRLFELFFRSARTARTAAGAGIGLFVCARLIRAMGGRIWAANRPDGGAEFGFSLRVMPEDD